MGIPGVPWGFCPQPIHIFPTEYSYTVATKCASSAQWLGLTTASHMAKAWPLSLALRREHQVEVTVGFCIQLWPVLFWQWYHDLPFLNAMGHKLYSLLPDRDVTGVSQVICSTKSNPKIALLQVEKEKYDNCIKFMHVQHTYIVCNITWVLLGFLGGFCLQPTLILPNRILIYCCNLMCFLSTMARANHGKPYG